MNRFFVEKSQIGKETIDICDASDVHHLVCSLRVKKDEELFISDGEGAGYMAQVTLVSRHRVFLKIKKALKKSGRDEQQIRISLGCAVPKGTRFEEVVEKTTQLGIDEIIPLLTERTFIKKDAFIKRMSRLQRIMTAAAKQSGVLFLPYLREAVYFEDFIKEAEHFDLCLLPNLSERPLSLKKAVASFKKGRILVLIGPEGDFSPREIDRAIKAGCLGVSLGDSVLRVDTAAISVLSFIKLFFNP